jgi:hypothetical protein
MEELKVRRVRELSTPTAHMSIKKAQRHINCRRSSSKNSYQPRVQLGKKALPVPQ